MPQPLHANDKKVRAYCIPFSNTSGRSGPIKLISVPYNSHSDCFYVVHNIPNPGFREPHLFKRISDVILREPVIGFFEVHFDNHDPLPLLLSAH